MPISCVSWPRFNSPGVTINKSAVVMRFPTRLTAVISSFAAIGLVRWISIPSASGQTPTTQPATQPSQAAAADEPAPDAPMRRWFDRLADPDPKVREQAKTDLMGISASDLPKLRQLVIDHQPIRPAQASALHEIVVQAYLAGQTYQAMNEKWITASDEDSPYFLGILWSPTSAESDARLGVTVDERLPGFPSYRYLRTGDMILGVYLDPTVSLLQLPNMETHTREQLIGAIGSGPNVQKIVLLVLRDGEQIRISVKMAPRPLLADKLNPGSLTTFIADRNDKADAYWQENFVPLLEARDAEVNAD